VSLSMDSGNTIPEVCELQADLPYDIPSAAALFQSRGRPFLQDLRDSLQHSLARASQTYFVLMISRAMLRTQQRQFPNYDLLRSCLLQRGPSSKTRMTTSDALKPIN
jgi:hypothetical protein